MPWFRRCCLSDRGQTVPLFAVVLVLLAALMVVVIEVGVILDERARARTAADAAALAGAVEGEGAAREVADSNGARLQHYEVEGQEVRVVVQVGRARAHARATATPIFEEPEPIP